MIEENIVDRVPTHPGRIKLTPVEGQTDVFDMVRADDPTVEGTPLDKATFNSIIQSRLTGRYYAPTVTRTVESSASSGANILPKSWSSVTSTGAVSGSYIVTASGSSSTGTPEKAFDGDNGTSWRHNDAVTGDTWLAVDFGVTIIITALRVYWNSQDGDRFVIRFQGSQNGSTWTDIATTNGSLTAPTTWNFENSTPYRHYRLHFNQGTVNDMRLYEWAVASWKTETYTNSFVIGEGVPNTWHSGQRIMISTPFYTTTVGVQSNTLNGVPVDTILQANKRYELRYDGSKFLCKEV